MEIFPIYIMSLYRMSDKDLKKRIRISDVVFKDLEESLMIFGESSKISIEPITSSRYLWPRVRTAGVQPGRDIHSGNLTAAHHCVHDCSILGSIVILAEKIVLT